MEKLSLSELRTIQFYNFDYKARGYYLFDTPIDIEPPYSFPFKELPIQKSDDGRVPNIFKQIGNLLSSPKTEIVPEEPILQPIPLVSAELKGFSFSFPQGQDISASITTEFINQLSFTETPISFEIIGTYETITFQIVCDENDITIIKSQIQAFFPRSNLRDIDVFDIGFDFKRLIGIADFGLSEESMLPIKSVDNYNFDPLTSFIGTLDNLHYGDMAMLQIMFKSVTAPFSFGMNVVVSDGQGGSFFADFPDLPKQCSEKTKHPLFATVIRIVAQGNNQQRTDILSRELIRNISTISTSQNNSLIPLSNKGYEYENGHLKNVYYRQSHRLGMILSSKEISTFFHFPNKSLVSKKLHQNIGKTKLLPQECKNQFLTIGTNTHNGIEQNVSLSEQQLLRHQHIIGSTGSGKSTLIANMMIDLMGQGQGCMLIEPHGDICDDILLRIPEHRKDDVIIIDPSDTDFPIGFNLLHAQTDAEKIVLSSDLVSAFKRHATAWGDTMTSVLSNAINCFLESEQGGTIIELKRFLIEDQYRNHFLETVEDNSIHYYWNNEYPLVKKRIAPLLTRIDTFLRPKIVRYMLAQKNGIDFRECIEQKKIVLIKLSQGLIGESNSFLLGSMFLSKINQSALGRQNLAKENRHPYFIFCDEFHNFIVPSTITSILSSARKYGISLTLAHQELSQIEDAKVLNSVISNPYIRICFRLGDYDAKKLENGFSYFEQSDLQSLNVGEAIMRVGTNTNDFNIVTEGLTEVTENAEYVKEQIIQNTRTNFARPKEEIKILLDSLLPRGKVKYVTQKSKIKEVPKVEKVESDSKEQKRIAGLKTTFEKEKTTVSKTSNFETQKKQYLVQAREQEVLRKHRSLQHYVRSMAQQRGFKATFEQETKDKKGRVDVALLKDELRIAVEISVTNTIEYEVKNIQKCIDDDFALIYMISDNEKHLSKIKELVLKTIAKKYHPMIHFFKSEDLSIYLDATEPKVKVVEKRIRGYRVKVNYSSSDNIDKQQSITNIIMKALRKK